MRKTASAALKPGGSGSGSGDFLVVAIGASAGGLEALEAFFRNTKCDSGLAYIVIQHLSPDFKSVMDQLLERVTQIPIRMIENGMQIEPDTIYLLPPSKQVISSGGKLLLTDRSPGRELTFPIDEFFRSLAQDAGRRAVGIILSGTGTDGSRGILDIHSAGGLVVAQSQASAAFDGMPRSACDTGVVDLVLAPESMPGALNRYRTQPDAVVGTVPSREGPQSLDHMDHAMRLILNLLIEAYQLDFTQYKAPTIARRIERRLSLTGTEQLEEYAQRLMNDREELEHLYRDLLIGVTGFFRDREVFERLELDVIPELIERLPPGEEFRAWVAGTATGEEAYSLAILLAERFEAMGLPFRARIFASDVHDQSLTFAARGIYQSDHLAGLLPERLERFFIHRSDGYHIVPELRKLVVFTPHNMLRDAPFTRLDMVTCRNVLIYFTRPAQRKALSLFHFGLKARGVLCLGASETLGDFGEEFEAIDELARIYAKSRNSTLPAHIRLGPLVAPSPPISRSETRAQSYSSDLQHLSGRTARLLSVYDQLLGEFMPPGILITERRELVHTFPGGVRFLRQLDGRPSNDAIDSVHPDLKSVLLAATRRVIKGGKPLQYTDIPCDMDGNVELIHVTVRPFPAEDGPDHILIQFKTSERSPEEAEIEVVPGPSSSDELAALDRELQFMRDNLQSTIEELQATNEELQGANEELTAANEELQSTNEELHSVNEELYTVNAEHQRKIDELTELTDDMDNLLNTTNVHTLFLDRDLRLRRFTPRIAELFNLIPQDVGRRIDSFTYNLVNENLVDQIHDVLREEQPLEREVQDRKGDWFLLRIFPYLSRGKVEGVVLTLVDITSLKRAADALKESEKRFDLAVRGSNEGIWDWRDITQEYVWCSERFYDLLGLSGSNTEMTFSLWKDCVHPEDLDHFLAAIDAHLTADSPFSVDFRLECGDGNYRWFHCSGAAERSEEGRVRLAGSLEDITESRRAHEEVREAVTRRDQFLAMLSHELRNPLGAILNAVHVMESSNSEVSMRGRALDVVRRQSRQMARLLDDLLDMSRITHGKFDLVFSDHDLAELINGALDVVRTRVEANDINLSVEADNAPLPVTCDSARLEQVFVNLLTNAIKYTPVGGDISVVATRENDEAVVTVRDSGVGIPPELIDEIFGLFVQSDETIDRSNGGMGVGLTLVKSVVEMHQGSVTAESDGVNSGSCFTVRLPLSDKPLPSEPPPVVGEVNVRQIVVVEDIDDARQMLELMLTSKGFDVTSAADGHEALEKIDAVRPDLALVDIGLPGIDGYEIARRIRANPELKETRLVALTGYGQTADREAVFEAGFDDHFVKPLKPEDLETILSPEGVPDATTEP